MKTRSGKGKNASQSRSASRSRSVSRGRAGKAKLPSLAGSSTSFKSARSASRSVSFNGPKPSGSDSVLTKSGRKKAVKQPGVNQKVAKLSKPVKEAVKKIFESPQVKGVYKHVNYSAINPYNDSLQYVFPIFVSTTDSIASGMFLPSDFIHAASVMWNNKTDSQSRAQSDSNNFPARNLQLKVINSYVAHTLRNNTQGEMKYTVWTCAPKDNGTSANIPDYVWQHAYTTLNTAGVINGGVGNTSLGEVPTKFKVFRDMFKSSWTTFVLKPGETRTWSTQGPKMYDLDTSAQWENEALYLPIAKYSRFVFVVVESPLTATTTGAVGRFTDVASGTGYCSVLENIFYTKLSMPEQAGFQTPAVFAGNSNIQLTQRAEKYYFYNYGAAQGGTIVNIDQEDPAVPETAYKG